MQAVIAGIEVTKVKGKLFGTYYGDVVNED